jgi:hypothetical protein
MGVELDASLYALDSTTIDLCLSLFPWARFRRHKAAVKMHTLLIVWMRNIRITLAAAAVLGGLVLVDPALGQGPVRITLEQANCHFLLGTHFTYTGQAPSRRVDLRMGRGSITIKNGPPSGPFRKD